MRFDKLTLKAQEALQGSQDWPGGSAIPRSSRPIC
jgi:hypothetical protein